MDSVRKGVEAFVRGGFVIVVDDEQRENEGDLVMAAELVTPELMGFMIRHTSGIICQPMLATDLERLRLDQMVADNTESNRTAFTVSVDHRAGTTTGVSASDRATTVRALVDPDSLASDFVRPGHVFPLRYVEGGVLKRAGHTEATLDLARIAALRPSGVLAELMNDDGTMMRLPDLARFATMYELPIVSIADLIAERLSSETLVRCVGRDSLLLDSAEFELFQYESTIDGTRHLAVVLGNVDDGRPVLTRVHRACLTGDVFAGRTCSCGYKLTSSLAQIAHEGRGVLVYLRDSERDAATAGIHVGTSQGSALDDADTFRDHGIGAQILRELGVYQLRVLSNSSAHYASVEGFGLVIVDVVPVVTPLSPGATAPSTGYDGSS